MTTWLQDEQARYPMCQEPPLPRRYASVTLADIGDPLLQVAVKDYLEQFEPVASRGMGPVFLGQAREYKTVAACALLKEIWKTFRVAVDFMPCGSLLSLELESRSAPTHKRLREWKRVPVLLMDDFAAPQQRTLSARFVTDVCNARWDDGLPTIVTGNLKLTRGAEFDRVAELYGAGIARRLQDAGKGFTVLV